MGLYEWMINRTDLAPKSEVYDKFGEEMGQIIIDERRIVFWKYGLPIGATFGAFVLILLIMFTYIRGGV